MKLHLLTILATGFFFAAATAQDDATKKDTDNIQGAWRLVSREKDGKSDAAEDIKDILMTNKGNTFSFKGSASGSGAMKGEFKLDAIKKPKAMDRIPADGPQKGKTLLAIYELDGDTLKICAAVTGKKRPTEFATKAGSGTVLSVFKREK